MRSGQRDSCELTELHDKLVLKGWIHRFTHWLLLAEMMPIAAADPCGRLRAGGEPRLGPLARVEIDRGSGAAHPSPHPPRIVTTPGASRSAGATPSTSMKPPLASL